MLSPSWCDGEEWRGARADGVRNMIEEARCPRERCRNHLLKSPDGDKTGDDIGSYLDKFCAVGVRVWGCVEGHG